LAKKLLLVWLDSIVSIITGFSGSERPILPANASPRKAKQHGEYRRNMAAGQDEANHVDAAECVD
jgi:hypothetical protein